MQWRGGSRARKHRPGREELDLDGPNQLWAWDISYIPIGTPRRFWFLMAIVDARSRKLVGHGGRGHRHVGQGPGRRGPARAGGRRTPRPSGLAVGPRAPDDLAERPGLLQRPRHRGPLRPSPDAQRQRHLRDLVATYKGERLWHTDYVRATPAEVAADLDSFVAYYSGERPHQGIDYVTPSERHDGLAPALIEARQRGMLDARARRVMINRRDHGGRQ